MTENHPMTEGEQKPGSYEGRQESREREEKSQEKREKGKKTHNGLPSDSQLPKYSVQLPM